MTLKEIRTIYNLSQNDASIILGIPTRTLRRYECDEEYGDKIKRDAFIGRLNDYFAVNEEKGILTIDGIKEAIEKLFDSEYKDQISFCYLFGSYAKGTAKETSDVDLCVSTTLTGLKFVGLIERIRQVLSKKIDLIRTSELVNNPELMNEIMKNGMKIYG